MARAAPPESLAPPRAARRALALRGLGAEVGPYQAGRLDVLRLVRRGEGAHGGGHAYQAEQQRRAAADAVDE